MSRRYNISGYEWELLEENGEIARRSQHDWYEIFLITNDTDYLDRLLKFYSPPPDSRKAILDGTEEILYQKSPLLLTDHRPLLELLENPLFLKKLSWRDFEELTAELLSRLGYIDIAIGHGSKDNGVDIVAFLEHKIGIEKIIVQCKKNSIENKVGEPIVKQLLADVEIHNASRGVIVTTSTLTEPSRILIQEKRHKISSLDRNELLTIMKDVNFNPMISI